VREDKTWQNPLRKHETIEIWAMMYIGIIALMNIFWCWENQKRL